MFYPENQKKRLDEKIFRNPPCEYRAAPFWAWNCDLNKDLLLREIDQMKRMGMGGFHMHVRTGMSTTYLSDGFMQLIRDCVDKAKEERMRAYLYDEDRWASGAAGGYVDQGGALPRKISALYDGFLRAGGGGIPASGPRSYPRRTGKGRLLARYAVRLNDEGELAEYRLLKDGQQADAAETARERPIWRSKRNRLGSTIRPMSTRWTKRPSSAFVEITHERYKEVVGNEFGGAVQSFPRTSEFSRKTTLGFAGEIAAVALPWTDDLADTFESAAHEELAGRACRNSLGIAGRRGFAGSVTSTTTTLPNGSLPALRTPAAGLVRAKRAAC